MRDVMSRIFPMFVIVAMLCVVVATQGGCKDVCTKTAATRAAATMLVADAQTSLAQAESVVTRIANQEVRDKAVIALAAARQALRSAEHVLYGVQSACTAPDIPTIFAEFTKAWKLLAPFLALLGGPTGGEQVATPMVVGMSQ